MQKYLLLIQWNMEEGLKILSDQKKTMLVMQFHCDKLNSPMVELKNIIRANGDTKGAAGMSRSVPSSPGDRKQGSIPVVGSAEDLVGRVLRDQGLGKYCDPEFVRAASREMQEAMDMTPEEFDAAAHQLLTAEAEGKLSGPLRLPGMGVGEMPAGESGWGDDDESVPLRSSSSALPGAPSHFQDRSPPRSNDGASPRGPDQS